MSDLSKILTRIELGEEAATDELLPLVYDELRRIAASQLTREGDACRLDATALVHEAYLRLSGGDAAKIWDGRRHFFAAAAESMRRILIEHARKRSRLRRGGDRKRRPLEDVPLTNEMDRDQLLDLDEALTRLASLEPEKAQLVKLRYFAGLTIDEAAHAMNISRSTAKRHWLFARAWLLAEMGDSSAGG